MSKDFVVSLGYLYSDICVVCGEQGEFGVARSKGIEGCKEAVANGQIYCWDHLPESAVENTRKILHKKLGINYE